MDDKKELVYCVLEKAQSLGCQEVSVSYYEGKTRMLEMRNGVVDVLQQASENRLTMLLYVDGRYGRYSTNKLVKEELLEFTQKNVELTRLLSADLYRKLPPKERMFSGSEDDLELFDHARGQQVDISERIIQLERISDEMECEEYEVISKSAYYSDETFRSIRVNSLGVEANRSRSYYSFAAQVTLKGEGQFRAEGYWSEAFLDGDKINISNIGSKALDRAVWRFGQEPAPSGHYSLLVDERLVSQLLSPIVSALSGSAIYQKSSFLIDKLGEKVISEKLTIYEDPLQKGAIGAAAYDSEGVSTERRVIFDHGILSTYYIDTYWGGKLGMPITNSSPSLLQFKLGNKNFDQLLSDINNGIYITGFNGGNCNPTTGDFSYGIEGILIENGKMVRSVAGSNLTGNMLDLWQRVGEIGSSAFEGSSWKCPAIVFDDIEIM